MARTKDPSLSERDRRIVLLRRNGLTYSEIAQMESISRVRVSQIVAEAHAELPEDETRAELAGLLEFAERKAIELVNNPGYITGPNGRVATDMDGEPVQNKSLVNDALKTLVLVADRKSRMYGADKQRQPLLDRPTAETAMWAALAVERAKVESGRLAAAEREELEALRRKLGSVTAGEVVRELGPGG